MIPKKTGIALLAVSILVAARTIFQGDFNDRFAAITDGKVYKPAILPPDKWAACVGCHLNKGVDLRDVGACAALEK